MSRLSTKQRRAAARRHAAVRPLEVSRLLRERYRYMTAADAQRGWEKLAAHPSMELMREHLDRHFLQPILDRAFAALSMPARRWFTLGKP